jgi:cyclic pyranopterin phosphate synthase
VSDIRILITHNCNCRCIHCHNDGLREEREQQERESIDYDAVVGIINFFSAKGVTDFTFSGGEPLLSKETRQLILDVLKHFQTKSLKFKIVTNALNLTNDVIAELAVYREFLSLNISTHSFCEKKYLQIMRPMTKTHSLEKAKNSISYCIESGLSVKINYTILNGLNDSEIDINDAIKFCYEIGTNAIKFLELVIYPDMANELYRYYRSVHSIERLLPSEVRRSKQDAPRRKVYVMRRERHDFNIELQRIVCAYSCADCTEMRDNTISPTLAFAPCLAEQYKYIFNPKNPESIDHAFSQNLDFQKRMAARYGRLSPAMTHPEIRFVERLCFRFKVLSSKISIVEAAIKGIIADEPFTFRQHRIYEGTESFYMPFVNYNYDITTTQIKLVTSHENFDGKIICDLTTEYIDENLGLLCIRSILSSASTVMYEGPVQEGEKLLEALGYRKLGFVDIRETEFIHLNDSEPVFSLSRIEIKNIGIIWEVEGSMSEKELFVDLVKTIKNQCCLEASDIIYDNLLSHIIREWIGV